MNFNSKLLTLAIILGLGFFLLSKKYKNQSNQKQKIEIILIIDEKKSEVTTPKVYISRSAQNGVEIGNNWKSK